MKLYPFDMPDGIHPLAWTLLGFGLDAEVIDKIARHLFDDLGARLTFVEPQEVTYSWQVSWPRPAKDGRVAVSIGDDLELQIPGGDRSAVQIISGGLPPGIRLEKHTGRLVGSFESAGLYSCTIHIGPAVKYDPLGGDGSPQSVGRWIPVDQDRYKPEVAVPDKDLSELSPLELDELIVQVQAAQRAKLIKEADSGN